MESRFVGSVSPIRSRVQRISPTFARDVPGLQFESTAETTVALTHRDDSESAIGLTALRGLNHPVSRTRHALRAASRDIRWRAERAFDCESALLLSRHGPLAENRAARKTNAEQRCK